MRPSLADSLEADLGTKPERVRAVSGGDINDAYRVGFADGRELFVKSHNAPNPGIYTKEAKGLRWLNEAGALRIPTVVSVSDGIQSGVPYLALEFIESGRPHPEHGEKLGRGLANLHRFGAPSFGLDHDNFIGRLYQPNGPCESWCEFYIRRRLEPQLKLAVEGGLASARMRRGFEKLFLKMGELVGPEEAPARVHGDLWGGNAIVDEVGCPVLIDPAVFGGHREVDLAMMRLFGGFGARVFASYEEAFPLSPGAAERVPLYQLYFLMVHVNLFGSSYVGGALDALERYI